MRKRNNIAEALPDYHIKTNVPPGRSERIEAWFGIGIVPVSATWARADLILFRRRERGQREKKYMMQDFK